MSPTNNETRKRIPRIIHTVWFSSGEFPDPDEERDLEKYRNKLLPCFQSWTLWNPHYDFMFWTVPKIVAEYNSDSTIEDNFPGLITILISKLPYVIKSDLGRLLVIWLKGGIYRDTDVLCLRCFDDLLKYATFAGRSYGTEYVGNAVIGSEPRNWLIGDALRALMNIVRDHRKEAIKRPEYFGVNTTAPFLLQVEGLLPVTAFNPYKWNEKEKASSQGFSYPDSYAEHLWLGTDPDGWATDRDKQFPEIKGPKEKPDPALVKTLEEGVAALGEVGHYD